MPIHDSKNPVSYKQHTFLHPDGKVSRSLPMESCRTAHTLLMATAWLTAMENVENGTTSRCSSDTAGVICMEEGSLSMIPVLKL